MIDFEKYKNKLNFPKRVDYTTVYGYTKGKIVFEYNGVEWQKATINSVPIASVIEHNVDHNAYNKAMKEYRADKAQAISDFKRDMFDWYGVTANSKADKAFELAWARGRSAGLQEVFSEFEELVDLLK